MHGRDATAVAACGVGTCQCFHSGPRVASRSILTSVHLHIPSTNTGQGGVHSRSSPSPSRWLQVTVVTVPIRWQGRGGPQCPGGTWIHAGPRVPSHLMALEIGASAALEQPAKPRPGWPGARATQAGSDSDTQAGTLRARPGRTEPASGLECSVHAGDTNPFINIQSVAVP